MQLYLIRHCQSENNALHAASGSSDGRSPDPELTDLGHRQARCLAQYLARRPAELHPGRDLYNHNGFDFTHLYSSLMVRAIDTGTYISKAIGMPLSGWEAVHERGGIYDGHDDLDRTDRKGLPGPNRAELADRFPDLILPEHLGEEGWWNRSYEDAEAAVERARDFLTELLEKHDMENDRVAVVTHGGFFQSIMNILFSLSEQNSNLGHERRTWLRKNNGSITRIDFVRDITLLTYVNRLDFMPVELIS